MKAFVVFILAISIFGCKESSFTLSLGSRLPGWFHVNSNVSREELKLTMDYYLNPWEAEVIFTLYGKDGNELSKLRSDISRIPLKLKNSPTGYPKHYPMYQVITINGITEIIEHRKMESVFYITDAPAVWKALGVVQE
ncbi:MAG: hypothetical protein GXP22_07815 [Gammaproteobacteria bacterium]|nr:hypothetical protein [Gammaproteobacteria bacterium]